MSLKLGRFGKDDEAPSAKDQEDREEERQGAYADSGVSPDVPAKPAFSAVWGTPDPSTTSEDSGNPDDADQTDPSDPPDTLAFVEGSIVPDPPGAPETSDAAEATSAPDTADAGEASAADTPDVTETSARSGASDASSAPEPAAADGRLPVAARLEEAAGDLDRPLLAHVAGLRASWQHIQFGFVDDPQKTVEDAADLVEHTAQALAAALQQRHRLLRSLWDRNRPLDAPESPPASVPPQAQPANRSRPADDTLDTEDLRLLMQRYRTLFNEICGP
jgi:hypothetical protein